MANVYNKVKHVLDIVQMAQCMKRKFVHIVNRWRCSSVIVILIYYVKQVK
jgi:hypothetical protein